MVNFQTLFTLGAGLLSLANAFPMYVILSPTITNIITTKTNKDKIIIIVSFKGVKIMKNIIQVKLLVV